jgi:hypothetical protein
VKEKDGNKLLNKQVWTEGLITVAIGVLSLTESLRLIFFEPPPLVKDLLGPGNYLLLMSIGMLVTGIIHIYHHRRERTVAKEKSSKEMRIRLVSCFLTCALYLILINLIGYLIATIIFFLLMFRVVGIKSWPYNVVLSVFLSVAFYLMFVKFSSLVFPKGIFFNLG